MREEKFYERYWDAHETGHLSDFGLKWSHLTPHIPKEKGITVLDFGCGRGDIMEEMRKINPDARYVGIDVSEAAVEDAQKKYPEFEFHVISDGGRFPLGDASVDFVFTSEVVEHVYDTENAFVELGRVLKPGGRVLLTTPYHGFVKNILLALFAFDTHFDPMGPHVRFFSNKKLSDAFGKNGMKVVRRGYYGRMYPVPHSVWMLAQKQ